MLLIFLQGARLNRQPRTQRLNAEGQLMMARLVSDTHLVAFTRRWGYAAAQARDILKI